MEVENIMKVIDIGKNTVSEHTQRFLEHFVTYQDKAMREDLYNVEDAVDDINDDQGNWFQEIESESERALVEKEIRMMKQLTFDNHAGYVRLVGH